MDPQYEDTEITTLDTQNETHKTTIQERITGRAGKMRLYYF